MSEPEYFYHLADGTQAGPMAESALRTAIAAGRVSPEVLAWTDGMPDWAPLLTLPNFAAAAASAPPPGSPQAIGSLPPPPSYPARASTPQRQPVSPAVSLPTPTSPGTPAAPAPPVIVIHPPASTPWPAPPAPGGGASGPSRGLILAVCGLLAAGLLALAAALALGSARGRSAQRPRTSAYAPAPVPASTPTRTAPGRQPPVVPDAYPTIQAALDAAHPGEVVRVRAGTYVESLSLPENARLEGDNRETVIVQAPPGAPALVARDLGRAAVSNLTFEQTSGAGAAPVVLVNRCQSEVQLRHCAVRQGGSDGILLKETAGAVTDCKVSSNAGSGIAANGGTPRVQGNEVFFNVNGITLAFASRAAVADNNVHENTGSGIVATGQNTEPQITHNDSSNNQQSGLVIERNSGAVAEGNICDANGSCGILVDVLDSHPVLRRNTCRRNGSQDIAETGSINAVKFDNVVGGSLAPAATPAPMPVYAPTPEPPAAATLPGERFPVTRLRYLDAAAVGGLSDDDLRYAINEMYARRGVDFRAEIQRQFANLPWYRERLVRGRTPDDADLMFSPVETANCKLLGEERDRRGLGIHKPPGYAPAAGFPGERYPQTRQRQLSPVEISGWSDAKLKYAINEMYARHQVEFNAEITRYFRKALPWYRPVPGKKPDDADPEFSDVERFNRDLLAGARQR